LIISLIAAVARNNTIGAGNALPWEMPADMRYFMAITRGHYVIMGRTSFEDIGKPLADRTNIILTRQTAYQAEGVLVVHSLEAALQLAEKAGEKEAFVIGGEAVFTEALPRADRIYLTRIDADFEGDTHFPTFDAGTWQEVSRFDHAADAENPHPYSFTVLERQIF
jgi:dihydrofolate reductase